MEGVARPEVPIVNRPTRTTLGGTLGQKGEAGDHLLWGDGWVTEGFWEVDLHGVVVVHGISIIRGKCDDKALCVATGFDYSGDFTDVGGGGVEIEVPRRGGFHESNFDGACTRERNVVIGKPPLFGLRVCDEEAGGDLGGLRPGWIQGRIVNSVAVEVGECFSKVPSFIGVGIDERLKTFAVAVLLFGRDVVISGVGIGDRVPDFLNSRVGADNHLVTGSANGISVVGREGEDALWGFRIIVESLGEGVVERRGHIYIPVEEGPGAENMKSVLQSGSEGVEVVVDVIRHIGGIDAEATGGQHFPFEGKLSRPTWPL